MDSSVFALTSMHSTIMDVSSPRARTANQNVITKLEVMFQSIVDALLQKQDEISISILAKRHSGPPRKIIVKFPGSNSQESWRFGMANRSDGHVGEMRWLTKPIAVLFRILGLVHEALTSNSIVSKR